jgi:diguanylate cyclase (GGDEF)-like protein/PAS domain S-box-containing protein
MKTPAPTRGWILVALGTLVLALSARASGLLTFFEHRAGDLRARALQREVATDIVIVGIDARSLADLKRWPWPRRYHARALEHLAAAQPKRVFIDIDFSSRADPTDDALLAAAMRRFAPGQLILPIFMQPSGGASGEWSRTRPLPELTGGASLASVVFDQSSDGLIRTARWMWEFDGVRTPSAAAAIAGSARESLGITPIDYSISPASFDYVSFVDLLAGRVEPSDLRGRTVLIGATALELGDMLPTPVHAMQPGIVVQALAAQSMRERPLRLLPEWLNYFVLTLIAASAALTFSRNGWRANLIVVSLAVTTLALIDLYFYAEQRIALEVAPALLIVGACFLVATFRALDYETVRAFAYSLGLRRKEALLGSIVESSTDCILCVDAEGRIRMANHAAERLFACDSETLRAAKLAELAPGFVEVQGPRAALDALSGSVIEEQARRADGLVFPVEVSVSRIALAEEPLYTVIMRDVTQRKAHEHRLQHQATHDSLTDLPNRTALKTALEAAIARAGSGQTVALLMLDLCRFKEVNDTLGHHIGDQALCEVARRFQAAIGEHFLARLGGDEFTIMLANVAGREQILGLAHCLNESLRTPIYAGGVGLDLGVSVGVALYPEHASEAAELLKHADVAMYVCKRRGSDCEFYDAGGDGNSIRRLAMVGELRHAIGTEQLTLHYQPQINLKSGRAESVEALLRWHHPQYGLVSPAEFIEIAESTDLIRPLTAWSIERALRQSAEWRNAGFTPRIAVNLSARLLQDTEFPGLLRSLLLEHGGEPGALEIEITESAMMLDPERALRVVRAIHETGVVLSIDDYGTGFSSLGYLRDLPVHALKLDRSFVEHLQERERDRSIVSSTLSMAHALGLVVVAEGVSTDWTAEYLARAGYDFAQGYFYSAAKPAEECQQWMRAFNAQRDMRHDGESSSRPRRSRQTRIASHM